MTARISVNGELRVNGREVEIIVKPGWTAADLQDAATLEGAPVRFTIEPVPPPPEPLTGGDEDINVRVRSKSDAPCLHRGTGVIVGYFSGGTARVRFGSNDYAIHVNWLERAPAECPRCGASQVSR
jgi:hypothetical protein